jgi:hypothetical protein
MSDFFETLRDDTFGVEADVVLDDMRRPIGRIIFTYGADRKNLRAFVQVWGPVFNPGDEVRAAIGEMKSGQQEWRTEAVAKALAQLRPGTGVEPDWALAAFIAAGEALQANPEFDYAEALEAQGLQVQYVL